MHNKEFDLYCIKNEKSQMIQIINLNLFSLKFSTNLPL